MEEVGELDVADDRCVPTFVAEDAAAAKLAPCVVDASVDAKDEPVVVADETMRGETVLENDAAAELEPGIINDFVGIKEELEIADNACKLDELNVEIDTTVEPELYELNGIEDRNVLGEMLN